MLPELIRIMKYRPGPGPLETPGLFSHISARNRPRHGEVRIMAAERHGFQAEVSRLLDIVAHSIYSDKAVFLRELISNASDACDRLRYLALTEPALTEGDGEFKIRLIPDKKAGTHTVADNGIVMNREELIENLGTIARSGTAAFMEGLS